jgi:thiol-disulfide isomerase/thioredoxin
MSRLVSSLIASALLILGTAGSPCRSARADTTARPAPEISGDRWLNSPPLHLADLRGQVVLVEFWTFACWNCQHVEPRMKQWHAAYRDHGLRVIGVHTPELAIEKDPANVERYVREHGITYPVAIDTDFATWNRYGNEAWPALYLIDRRGQIRYVRVGEGAYEETERQIDALLRESPADATH